MISFNQLGKYGRLGNQLFQYAFLRTTAGKLNTRFYCPPWKGDEIFNLKDSGEKTTPFNARFNYTEGPFQHGYNIDAQNIKNDTDIGGYFQSDKFFSKNDIKEWYYFNESNFSNLKKKYAHIDFANSTAIHLRLGDYFKPSLQFYVAKRSYFKKAMNVVSHKRHVLIFSDEPKLAREYLKDISPNALYIEDNEDYEDLYLMSHCRDIVCSASSFSWWAAYLNVFDDKTVIMPSCWFLPGAPTKNKDIFVDGWIKIRAHRWFDNYYVRAVTLKLLKFYKRFSSFILPSRTS